MPAWFSAEAGNVFRSITRTERARCTPSTYAHSGHVFPMKTMLVRESCSAIQYEVNRLGVCMWCILQVCVSVCCLRPNYHLNHSQTCKSGNGHVCASYWCLPSTAAVKLLFFHWLCAFVYSMLCVCMCACMCAISHWANKHT